MNRYLAVAAIGMIGFIIFLISIISDLHDDKKTLEGLVNQANDVIAKYERDQQIVADIDRKYSKALNDAKDEIDKLYAGVIAGSLRLQLNAECAGTEKASAGRVVNGKTARLTDSAKRDYFLLRQRIEINEKQILGLQEYINTVCLN